MRIFPLSAVLFSDALCQSLCSCGHCLSLLQLLNLIISWLFENLVTSKKYQKVQRIMAVKVRQRLLETSLDSSGSKANTFPLCMDSSSLFLLFSPPISLSYPFSFHSLSVYISDLGVGDFIAEVRNLQCALTLFASILHLFALSPLIPK